MQSFTPASLLFQADSNNTLRLDFITYAARLSEPFVFRLITTINGFHSPIAPGVYLHLSLAAEAIRPFIEALHRLNSTNTGVARIESEASQTRILVQPCGSRGYIEVHLNVHYSIPAAPAPETLLPHHFEGSIVVEPAGIATWIIVLHQLLDEYTER